MPLPRSLLRVAHELFARPDRPGRELGQRLREVRLPPTTVVQRLPAQPEPARRLLRS